MTKFVLEHPYIELYKLLKLESLASSGGEAKQMIAAGQVRVNDEIELRKRKKLVIGDCVQIAKHKITLVNQAD